MAHIIECMLVGTVLLAGCAAPQGVEVGPRGGMVMSDDGRFTVEIPKGALEQDIDIVIDQMECEPAESVGPCYVVEPVGLPLLTPGTVTVDLDWGLRDGLDVERLTVLTENERGWNALADREVDTRDQVLTASAVYLGSYALATVD
ncbi:MAG: hypothetical protein AAGF11_26305 [Myxococcota bacterium]